MEGMGGRNAAGPGRGLRLTLLALALAVPPAVPQAATHYGDGPRCPPNTACIFQSHFEGDYFYKIEGIKLMVHFSKNSYLLTCPKNVSLENEALPRFEPPVDVQRVKLAACGVPAGGLAAGLRALGVRPRDSLELENVPAGPALAAAPDVPALMLAAAPGANLSLAPGFLAPLAALKDLRLVGVALRPDELLALSAGLKVLQLADAGLTELPRAVLQRLPKLQSLTLADTALAVSPDLSVLPNLTDVTLTGPVDGLVSGPALEVASLMNPRSAEVRGDCGVLRRLVVSGAAEAPPVGWLRGCGRLTHLALDTLPPAALSGAVLAGATALTSLTIQNDKKRPCNSNCSEIVLAHNLLEEATQLRELNLQACQLRKLPKNLFGASTDLEILNLSSNNLTADAIRNISQFTALRKLDLTKNPLGDLCHSSETIVPNDASPLHRMAELSELRLSETHLTHLCVDWRVQLRRLRALDLRHNRLVELEYASRVYFCCKLLRPYTEPQYDDLRWMQAGPLTVDLTGNRITTVRFNREDVNSTERAPPRSNHKIQIDPLTCNCEVYWFAVALRAVSESGDEVAGAARRAAQRHPLAGVRCSGLGTELVHVPLERLTCDVPATECAANCSCAVTPVSTVLRCERAGLDALPRVFALPPPREMRLAGNRIARLSRDDLPPELEFLDLSDNQIVELDTDTATALFENGRQVALSGNRLACGCGQLGALRVLQAHAAQLRAARNVTCAGGHPLLALPLEQLCRSALLPGAIAAVVVVSVALAVAALSLLCLLRPAVRRRIKKFLFEHNLCLKLVLRPSDDVVEDEEGERYDYDAFVSFSHHDEKFVIEELVPGLERRSGPRRLCLHYRDWAPGAWIPTQIADSVRRSRRTVVVLSEHFLRSTWARAEFRAAHAAALRDARPRLVAVLLAELPPELLDDELRHFLATNTYVRAGDPWFWSKLLHAVPRGAARLPPPADADADAAPPAAA